uniref:Anaphase-promoting complex subunit 2 TPR repeats domain-containing protein n=1 Tax=Nelumbo nucifera TaxID=4432 RepID=A0A822XR90_NELNU|nr:TPA_asm: hypothetical protein HUJ06_022748 [Nelumbo nucifera]
MIVSMPGSNPSTSAKAIEPARESEAVMIVMIALHLGDSVSYDSPSSGMKSPLASHPSSSYYGINTPSEGLVRWQLRLEYFAYETLQDLRIAKLFEIIVDYPER